MKSVLLSLPTFGFVVATRAVHPLRDAHPAVDMLRAIAQRDERERRTIDDALARLDDLEARVDELER